MARSGSFSHPSTHVHPAQMQTTITRGKFKSSEFAHLQYLVQWKAWANARQTLRCTAAPISGKHISSNRLRPQLSETACCTNTTCHINIMGCEHACIEKMTIGYTEQLRCLEQPTSLSGAEMTSPSLTLAMSNWTIPTCLRCKHTHTHTHMVVG